MYSVYGKLIGTVTGMEYINQFKKKIKFGNYYL